MKGERKDVTLQRATGKLLPPRSGPLPPTPDYKGVYVLPNARTAAVFSAQFTNGGVRQMLGSFCSAEEAARAYDDAQRKAGSRVMNFPRPGTEEVQAVRGEEDRTTLQRATGKRAPSRIGPLPPAPAYKGVTVDPTALTSAVFVAYFGHGHTKTFLGRFCTAKEAARAYDDAMRKAGRRCVNFPCAGTDEVQAVKGEEERVTLQRAAGKRAPPRSGPLPPDPGYKGVHVDANVPTAAVFAASCFDGGVRTQLGYFCTAEEAARAYDDAARNAGRIVVNFPRAGTDEVQAVKGEREERTLARHSAAQQAAGGAGAAGAFPPPDTASPPSKRRAAAPPPSEPPRKRATAPSIKPEIGAATAPEAPVAPPPAPYTRRPPHRIERESSLPPGFVAPAAAGIKTETPAAVKPEAPVAPPHVPYTASTGRPLQAAFAAAQAALAASLPPDDGPGLEAPSSGSKTETPAAVKLETPAAPPMPAVAASGCPSPAPPSAAAALPVKMEHDDGSAGALRRKRDAQRGAAHAHGSHGTHASRPRV